MMCTPWIVPSSSRQWPSSFRMAQGWSAMSRMVITGKLLRGSGTPSKRCQSVWTWNKELCTTWISFFTTALLYSIQMVSCNKNKTIASPEAPNSCTLLHPSLSTIALHHKPSCKSPSALLFCPGQQLVHIRGIGVMECHHKQSFLPSHHSSCVTREKKEAKENIKHMTSQNTHHTHEPPWQVMKTIYVHIVRWLIM